MSNEFRRTSWTDLESPIQSMDLLRVHYTFLDTVRVGVGDLTGTTARLLISPVLF